MQTMGGGSKANRRKRRYQSPNRGGKRRRLPQTDSPAKDGDNPKVMIFQECAQSILNPHTNNSSDVDGKTDTASVFFDLANSPLVGYRIEDNRTIVIRQDNNCAIHTGGIVWETSYLLAEFLAEKFGKGNNIDSLHPLGKTLEIGAGCGMLGLILATNGLSSKVVLTEASEVMSSLRENVDRNVTDDKAHNLLSGNDAILHSKGIHGTIYKPACPKHRVSVRQLRWEHLKADIKSSADSSKDDTPQYMTSHDLEPHSFDTIIGTDVVFSPSLVCPLLRTISKMARKRPSKSKTRKEKDVDASKTTNRPTLIYLCLQIRCPDSHVLLFTEAPKYGLEVIDISNELTRNNCEWGLELECMVLQINVVSKKHCKEQSAQPF
jgi:hypothetical protein